MSSDSLSPIEAARNILAEKYRIEEKASELVEGLAIDDENDEVINLEDNDYEEFDEDEEDQDNLEEESPEMKPKKPSMAGEKGAAVEKDATGKSAFDATGKGPVIGTEAGTEGFDKKNKKSISSKSSDASPKIEKPHMKEHMDALFAGEELTEDFKEKASTIFEAAVNDSLSVYAEALEENYNERLMETASIIEENLTAELDDYLGYVVENWMKENELAVERGIRAEVAESFMEGLRRVFADHYIDIPEDKFDVVEGMAEELEDLTSKLNEQIERNMEMRNEMETLYVEGVFADMTEDLVDTDVEKLSSLAEGIDFDSAKQFADKLAVLKESYFTKSSGSDKVVFMTEESDSDEPQSIQEITGPMNYYAQAISRQTRK